MSKNQSALRAILRLKAGLSPLERVEDITVDIGKHRCYLDGILARASTGAFGVVLGQYGSGKTHFLQTARAYGLDRGFAVARLGQDSGLSYLSQPQRHLSTMLSSLTAPPPFGNVLLWLGSLADDVNQVPLLEQRFRELAAEYTEARHAAEIALMVMRHPQPHLRSTKLVEYLSGAFLVGRPASARNQAYELLQFWTKFCTHALGLSGLLLLIDEMESLFSNAVYRSWISRRAAYRSLSFYATSLQPAATLCAFTPEGWDKLRTEMKQDRRELSSCAQVRGEDLTALFDVLEKTHPYELFLFSDADYRSFYERLRALHAEARSYLPELGCEEPFVSTAASRIGVTPRIFSKSVMSFLEAGWMAEKSGVRNGVIPTSAVAHWSVTTNNDPAAEVTHLTHSDADAPFNAGETVFHPDFANGSPLVVLAVEGDWLLLRKKLDGKEVKVNLNSRYGREMRKSR